MARQHRISNDSTAAPGDGRRLRRLALLTVLPAALVVGLGTAASADAGAYYYEDVDANGTYDARQDVDGDDYYEVIFYDRNGDGAWDYVLEDRNRNGWMDTHDSNADGFFEAHDRDEDGYPETSLMPLPTSPPVGNYGRGNDFSGMVSAGDAFSGFGCAHC